MIERFYQPTAGEIFLDEMDIKDVKLKKLRESIGYVSQEPVLVMGSIKDNLLLGNRDATDKEMVAALKQAKAKQRADAADNLSSLEKLERAKLGLAQLQQEVRHPNATKGASTTTVVVVPTAKQGALH
jgi:ABC-type multidrug transport system fused ATPase/permease subunit